MINFISLVIVTITTLLALVNALGLFSIIQKGLKLDEEGYKKFDQAMIFLTSGLFFLVLGHLMGLLGVGSMAPMISQFLGAITFVFAVNILSKIPSGLSGSLKVDWGELGKEVAAIQVKHKTKLISSLSLQEHVKGKSIVLIKAKNVGLLSVFDKVTSELSTQTLFPLIGVITPYDIKKIWAGIGDRGGVWITRSQSNDAWVNKKFIVGKPSELFQLTNYINVVSEKLKEKAVFVGDFLDEIHGEVNEAQLRQLFSRMKTILQKNNSQCVIFLDEKLHSPQEISVFERYSDVKIDFNETIETAVCLDLQTNKKTVLG